MCPPLCPSVCDRLHRAYDYSPKKHNRFKFFRRYWWDGSAELAHILRPCHIMRVCRHALAVRPLRKSQAVEKVVVRLVGSPKQEPHLQSQGQNTTKAGFQTPKRASEKRTKEFFNTLTTSRTLVNSAINGSAPRLRYDAGGRARARRSRALNGGWLATEENQRDKRPRERRDKQAR